MSAQSDERVGAVRYRDHWTIDVLYMGPFSYQGTHDDFDGAPTYSDGPVSDKRCFVGRTIEDVQEQIDEYEAES